MVQAIKEVRRVRGRYLLTMAVVNGMLSMKDEAKADTHSMRIRATASLASGGTS